MYDFPASPTEDQEYTPAGGVTYIFKTPRWLVKSVGGGGASVTVSDTAPASPTAGSLWYEADSGNTYIWYSDADSSQWVQQNIAAPVTEMPSGLTAETRNRVVNGAMQISQEFGDTGSTVSGAYGADQWSFGSSTIPAASTIRGSNATGTPAGNRYVLALSVNTAKGTLAAGDFLYQLQPLEGGRVLDFGYGTASARQAVLRFAILSPTAGTFTASIRNAAADRSYLADFSISAEEAGAWTVKTIVIPGDTTGTWLTTTGIGMYLTFCFACGTTYQGVAGWQAGNKMGTVSTTNFAAVAPRSIYVTDVGLYLDPLNTGVPPRWQMPDEAEEFRACQRYYRTKGGGTAYENISMCQAYGAGNALCPIFFDFPMRSTPAYSGTGSFGTQTAAGGTNAVSGTALGQASVNMVNLVVTTGGLVAGNATGFYTNNDLNARLKFSARM